MYWDICYCSENKTDEVLEKDYQLSQAIDRKEHFRILLLVDFYQVSKPSQDMEIQLL